MNEAMDLRLAFEILLGICIGLMGWFLRSLFDRIKSIENKLDVETSAIHQLRVDLPTNYVTKGDFRGMGDAIFGALRRIEDKLDNKVDKP